MEERKSGLLSLSLNTMTIQQITIKIDGIIKVKLSYNNNTLYMERYYYRHPILLYNDWSKHKVLENPNWQGADQLVIYTAQLRS